MFQDRTHSGQCTCKPLNCTCFWSFWACLGVSLGLVLGCLEPVLVGLYLLSCSIVRLFACLLASLPARLRAFIVCLLSCYCTCLFAQDGDMRRKEAWAFSFSRVNSLHMNPVIGCYPGTSPSRGSRAVNPGLQRSGCNDPKAGIAIFSSSRRPVILLFHQCFVFWVMQRLALLSHRHLVSLICHQRVLARMKEDGGAVCG